MEPFAPLALGLSPLAIAELRRKAEEERIRAESRERQVTITLTLEPPAAEAIAGIPIEQIIPVPGPPQPARARVPRAGELPTQRPLGFVTRLPGGGSIQRVVRNGEVKLLRVDPAREFPIRRPKDVFEATTTQFIGSLVVSLMGHLVKIQNELPAGASPSLRGLFARIGRTGTVNIHVLEQLGIEIERTLGRIARLEDPQKREIWLGVLESVQGIHRALTLQMKTLTK
ncbi:hypothetical protein ES703_87637 [subsurface metagenome]